MAEPTRLASVMVGFARGRQSSTGTSRRFGGDRDQRCVPSVATTFELCSVRGEGGTTFCQPSRRPGSAARLPTKSSYGPSARCEALSLMGGWSSSQCTRTMNGPTLSVYQSVGMWQRGRK